MRYDHKTIEKKWQDEWDRRSAFAAKTDPSLPKYYALVEFPYPSGQGLHIGHPRPYTAMDIIARKKRMQGYNVLFPMGWDAFGLPTENYAIKNRVKPQLITESNIATFRRQIKSLGLSFDWTREISTTDPSYYRWTQWIFIQLFKHNLAYKKEMAVNFCTSCKVVLANEEVVGGVCERCSGEVVRKIKSQWMLKITEYAQRLIDGLDGLDFIERVKTQEINWIGRSEGAEVIFETSAGDIITVFTTRPETLFGATYMVVSPEHGLVDKWMQAGIIENGGEVAAYQAEAAKKSEFERTELAKEKTGIMLKGIKAKNPANGEHIPVFISDYVLASYGTGAIMSVPGHDTRDWEFARALGLPIVQVIAGKNGEISELDTGPFIESENDVMVNSGLLNGLKIEEAKKKIVEVLAADGLAKPKVNYKLRDWIFSRQRYWGEPVPMVWCDKCGWVPLPEDQLPLMLPDIDEYEPTDTGESPLAKCEDWLATTCPKCAGPGRRETDVMPNWAGSSWYFMRYCDPHCDHAPASREALDYWMPVDWYNGGMEHVTLHLLYSRFWAQFLYDIGMLSYPEPYLKRTAHGMILGENGEKMSKSKGNVINPDDIIEEYGADTLRLYEMFIGDFEKSAPWSPASIRGCRRFLERVSGLPYMISGRGATPELEGDIHKTIKKVTHDIENMKFNTAIAAMMTLTNKIYEIGRLTNDEFISFITLLCPFAPHLCEEIYSNFTGNKDLLSNSEWPKWDESKTVDSEIEIAVQICGRLRGTIMIPAGADSKNVIAAVRADESFAPYLESKTTVREIYVPGKLVNIVVK